MKAKDAYPITARLLVQQHGMERALRHVDSQIKAQNKLGNRKGAEGWKEIRGEIMRLSRQT